MSYCPDFFVLSVSETKNCIFTFVLQPPEPEIPQRSLYTLLNTYAVGTESDWHPTECGSAQARLGKHWQCALFILVRNNAGF